MSNIEDIRKILQDLIAPSLSSLATKLDDFRAETNRRFEDVNRRFEDVNRRFEDADKMAALRHETLMRELQLNRRMDELEERLSKPPEQRGQ